MLSYMGSWSHYLAREPTASFGLHWCLFTVNLFPLGRAHRQPSQHHINLIYGLIAAQNITIPLGGGLSLPHAAGRKRTGGWRRLKPFSRIKIGCLLPVALKTWRKKNKCSGEVREILWKWNFIHWSSSAHCAVQQAGVLFMLFLHKNLNFLSAISALCHVSMWTPFS